MSSPPKRKISVRDMSANRFASNRITTAKYSIISFVPRFLLEQFRQYSYLFFLFSAIIQQIPNVSPTGKYTTILPLSFILIVSAVRESYEDIKRHRADRIVNRTPVLLLNRNTTKWETKVWKTVRVGDFVKVNNNHFFPSDLLLISSSEPNGIFTV
jgi:phospholipid-transporting ATPase